MHRLIPGAAGLDTDEALEEEYLPPSEHHLRVNFVASLDGAVEIEGRSGPLGSPADRRAFMAMRAVADVVLVGAGTARAENYGPVRLDPAAAARREARGWAPRPRLAVVTARGFAPSSGRLFEGPDPVIVLTTQAAVDAHRAPGREAEVVVCGADRVDLRRAVEELGERGLGRVLCEGGPTVTKGLMSQRLVDELSLSLAPVLAGEGHRPLGASWSGSPGRWALTSVLEEDGMLLTRYRPADR